MEKTQEQWVAEAIDIGKQMFAEFLERLQKEIDKAVASEEPLTLCLTEEDDPRLILPFQQAEQSPLTDIANLLRVDVRGFLIQWGYEKLAFITPEREHVTVAPMVRNGLAAVANHQFKGEKEHLTVSAGLASFPEHGLIAEELAAAALEALEAAQAAGGNRVIIAQRAGAEDDV